MPSTISLLVAYPKELIRSGIRAMVVGSGIQIVGEAADATRSSTLAEKRKPMVMLLDATLPGADAFDLVRTLSKSLQATRFLFLSALENPTYMARAHAVGAANCLLKSVSQRELITAIQDAAAGKPAPGTSPFGKVVASMEARKSGPALHVGLTSRESQVLSHVAFGLSNDEIAQSLTISVETVKEHVQNMLRKMDVRDRTQAAVWALKSGLT